MLHDDGSRWFSGLVVAAALAVVPACGVGGTLPMATRGEGAPIPDAGPLACDGDLATFTDVDLATFFGCGSCHMGGNPQSAGLSWGPGRAFGDTPAGWHEASLVAAMRAAESSLPIEETTLFRHFDGSDETHFVNEGAKTAMTTWLTAIRAIPACAGGGPVDAGPPTDAGFPEDAGVLPPPDAGVVEPGTDGGCRTSPEDALAAFPASIVTKFTSCAGCHRSAASSPSGVGQAWGIGSATSDAQHWFDASKVIADRPGQDADVAANALTTHVDGTASPHPNDDGSATAMTTWLNVYYGEVACGGGGPIDAGPADGGATDGGA